MTASPMMDAQRWQRLRALLDRALDLDDAERKAMIAALPAADAELGEDLQRLLTQHASNEQQRSLDPIELAAPMLVDAQHAADASETARVGQHIGAFKLLRLIGTGGMGAVYLAERNVENFVHRVALKVVRGESVSAAARERFERERQILANLVHPHIGTLFEGGQTAEGQPYYTMEYVDGIAITDYCRDRQLGVEQRVRLLIDVAAALAHAHQNLVVHRDIKPSNILVSADGRARLLDFGIAKLVGNTDAAATQGAFGPMTPEYAAPEQFHNAAVTVATDIYQFGVLCFRVLTGSLPYRADSGDSLAWAQAVTTAEPTLLARALDADAARQAWKDPAKMARVKRQLRGDLDAIVRKALAKAPQDRYRSMDALSADLDAYLDGRPVAARRAGAWYFMRRFVARRPWAVAAASVAVIALLAATAISVRAAQRAELQAHRAEVANRFLLTALDLTDRFSGNNRGDFTLAEVLERAVAQAHTDLRDEPDARANVLTQLSLALQHRGKSAAALAAAREAHEIRIAAHDGDALALATAARQLASVEIESGLLDEAAGHLQETLRQLAIAGNPDGERIHAYTSLGKLASMRGDAEASLRWYQQIIPLRQSLAGDHVAELAMDYNNLGTGLHNLSRFRDADAAFIEGISLLRGRFGADHPRIGFIEYGRSASLIQLGRFDEARALLADADRALGAGGGSSASTPGLINTERMRALLDYYNSDYASALHRLDAVLPQTQAASPISVADTFALRGRIELASGDASAAAASFAAADRLYLANGRAEHPLRWYARGLGGVARAAVGEVVQGDGELDEALAHLVGDGMHASVQQAELLLYSGAAARRRGDVATALVRHRRADAMQRQLGWLGELGAARVEAELAQEGLAAGADAPGRDEAAVRLAHSIEVLRRIAPHEPRLAALLALQHSVQN